MLRAFARNGRSRLQSVWHPSDASSFPVAAGHCLSQWAGLTAGPGSGGGGGSDAGTSTWRRKKRTAGRSSQREEPSTKQQGAGERLTWLARRFKKAAYGNDALSAEHHLCSYIREGGALKKWMLPMLLGAYGRLRHADKAWAVYQRLLALRGVRGRGSDLEQQQQQQPRKPLQQQQQQQQQQHPTTEPPPPQQQQEGEGCFLAAQAERLVAELRLDALPMDQWAYSALLCALSRAEHPPYDLHPRYAHMAACAFEEMRGSGVEPNVVLWHNLIDCQAKAGLPDAALSTYRAMLAAGASPTSWTFSMLVSACGRARQPQRAADVVERLMPQAGVKPDLPVWNALLGAHGRTGSVDAAYAAWVNMLEAGATPDDCTERVLALAFGSHPALAAEVVAEARQIQLERQAAATAAVTVDAQETQLHQRAAAPAAAAAAAATDNGTAVFGGTAGEAAGGLAARTGLQVGGGEGAVVARQQQTNGWWERLRRRQQEDGGAGRLSVQLGTAAYQSDDELAAAVQGGSSSTRDGGTNKEQRSPYRPYHHRQPRLAVDHIAERCPEQYTPLGLLLVDNSMYGSTSSTTSSGSTRSSFPGAKMVANRGDQYHAQDPPVQEGEEAAEGAQLRKLLLLDLHGSSQAAARMVVLHRLETLVLRAPELTAEVSRMELSCKQHDGKPGTQPNNTPATSQPVYIDPPSSQPTSSQPTSSQSVDPPSSPPSTPHCSQPATQPSGQSSISHGSPHRAPHSSHPPSSSPFTPPSLVIITGVGRHSRGAQGGVLKAAVRQLLLQQGLPVRDDPNNEGVLFISWAPLAAYLQSQRQAMHTDQFLMAARLRYLYILSAVGGVAAAAHILPRLAPWMA